MPYSNSFGEKVLKRPNFKPANPWVTMGTKTINMATSPETAETMRFNFEVLRDGEKIGYGYIEQVKTYDYSEYYNHGAPAIWFDGNDEKPLYLDGIHPFGEKVYKLLDGNTPPNWENWDMM